MVNELTTLGVNLTDYKLEDLLSIKQLHSIVKECTNMEKFSIIEWVLTKASEGLSGFLGDHLRLTLRVDSEDRREEIKLFIKCLPNKNKPKVEFLRNNLFYRREEFVVNELLKDAGGYEEPNPWRPKVYVCNEEIIVMKDVATIGYTMFDKRLYFDMDHSLLALSSLAKYHAASVNYETKKSERLKRVYKITEEYSDLLTELNFKDTPWLRAGARMTSHFLGVMSKKYDYSSVYHQEIEAKICDVFLEACHSINTHENDLNVIIHKDLWTNNLMFKYDAGKPVAVIMLDFQCVRYAPPAFDVSSFLYLNTSRSFREHCGKQVLRHYYHSFIKELSNESARKLEAYTFEKFLQMFEASKMFGLLVPILIFPYVIMDPLSAKKYFDDPETYEHYNNKDRSGLVVDHAKVDSVYRNKYLEVCEEFVEKFVL